MTDRSRSIQYLLLFIAGTLFPLGLAPFMFWPLVILSMAVLFSSLTALTVKKAFLNTLVYGFGIYIAGASWLYVSIHEYGFIPAPLAMLATILFCLFLASVFAMPFALAALVPDNPQSLFFGLPALWVISEWMRTWVFTGFPWLFAGYSHTETWLNGWAPIGGVLWLSFISAVLAMLLTNFIRSDNRQAQIGRFILGFSVIFGSGWGLQQLEWTKENDKSMTVALVQPNISQKEKWSPSRQAGILKQLSDQTKPVWGQDLIVWPEAAIPTIEQRIPTFMADLQTMARDQRSTLLTGIIRYDAGSKKYHNSLIALDKNQQNYDKTRLVPFGEYVPLENLLRGLIRFFDLPMSSLSLGDTQQHPFMVKDQTIAPSICYEVVYPDLIARISSGSSMLLTVSNDTWFGSSLGPLQHMQMAQMRAIENAKPMIRATNNGISGLIDHRGNVYERAQQNISTVLSGQIQPRVGRTLFSYTGSL
ncbi:MAG: apolipoprotein N-acyltransferase, partial [Porticoccaceae bacterium]|nr:apolipoprotein N-acyltransferase [Porticoccaceae bacterium]